MADIKKEVFSFKEFQVHQESVSWKIGTDSVLLGAWCTVQNYQRCLDLGCGTGILSLMVAQRNPQIQALGIELDAATVDVAAQNFANSPWADRLQVRRQNILEQSTQYHMEIGLVICNPPFFPDGLISPDQRRKGARHGHGFTYRSLPELAARVLSDDGALSVVLPLEYQSDLIARCRDLNLFPGRLTYVRHNPEAASKRVLMEFGRSNVSTDENEIILYNGKRATAEYRDLISAFRDESPDV